MAITQIGTTGGNQGLFNRLGKLLKIAALADTYRLTTLPGAVEAAMVLFDGTTVAVRDTADELLPLLSELVEVNNPGDVQSIAEAVVIQMINADNPRPDLSVDEALAELMKQVNASGNYVDANTVSASVTQTSLDGNGVVLASTLDARGRTMQNLLAEDLEIRSDGSSLEVLGEPAVDRFSEKWPKGSGSRAELPLIQADGSNNILQNGSFDFNDDASFTWDLVEDTGGGFAIEDTIVYKAGGSAMRVTSNGSTLTHLRQEVTDQLSPETVYAVNLWTRLNATAAAGVATIRLHDGTSVLQDEAGNNCSFTIDLTALTTGYLPRNGFIRTPSVLPATVYFDILISTALTNTRIWYVDHLAMGEAERPSGDAKTPYLIAFEGSVPFSVEDGRPSGVTTFKVAVANNKAGEWQQGMERLFSMTSREYQLPTSGGGSEIDESLMA